MWAKGRLKQGFKILASGALFSLLGLGGLLATALVVPFLRFGSDRQRRARRFIQICFKGFVWALQGSGILKLEVEGLPEDPRTLDGCLLLPNHPGYLDVVLLIAVLGRPCCVVKNFVYDNLLFGRVVRAAGYVANRDPEGLIAEGASVLRQGDGLILFPEGTRSHLGEPLRFQRGAAHIALESGALLRPILVTCEPPLLSKGAKWYDIPLETCRYRIRIQPQLDLDVPRLCELPRHHAARTLTHALEQHFHKELHESGRHAP